MRVLQFFIASFITIKMVFSSPCLSDEVIDIQNNNSCIKKEVCKLTMYLSNDETQCVSTCDVIYDNVNRKCIQSQNDCQNYLSIDRKYCIQACAQGEYRVDSNPKKCYNSEDECRSQVGVSGTLLCVQKCSSEQSMDELTPDPSVKRCITKSLCKGVVVESNPNEFLCQSKCPNGKLTYIDSSINYNTCKEISSCLLSIQNNTCVKECNSSNEVKDMGFSPNICINKNTCPLVSSDGSQCIRTCQISTEVIDLSKTPKQCIQKSSCPLLSISGEECVQNCPAGTYKRKIGQAEQYQCVISCREKPISSDNLFCVDSCQTGEIINTLTENQKNCIKQENCTQTISLDGKYCNKQCQSGEVRDQRTQNQPNKCILKVNCSGGKSMTVIRADQQEYCLNCLVSSCKTCVPNDETKCSVCNDSLFLSLDDRTCRQYCEANEYFNSTDKTCKLCSQYCQECQSESICKTCEGTANLINGLCYLKCTSNQYRDELDHTCKSCHSSCLTCENGADNSCLTCKPNLYYTSSLKTCTSTCQNGQSPSFDKKTCQACTVTQCSACIFTSSSNSTCTQCQSGYLLNKDTNKCETTCPPNYTQDAQNTICIKCQAPCNTCQTSSTNCLTCITDFYLHLSNQCVDTCPNGYYSSLDSNSIPVCKTCRVGCTKCDSDVLCTECDTGYYLGLDQNKNKICMQTCPNGTYADSVKKSCESCPSLCLNCLNGTSCSKCKPTYYLHQNSQCLLNCPASFYADTNDYTCKSCPNNCDQCNSTTCQKCKTGFVLQDGQCKDKCNDGYYNNNSVCVICSNNCKLCTNEFLCQSCNDNFFLENDGCVSNCSAGKYKKLPERICDDCFANCSECSDKTTCNKCNSNYLLSTKADNSQSCVTLCPKGTFANTLLQKCENCLSNCEKCSNGTTCDVCLNTFFLSTTKAECLVTCPEHHYTNQDLKKCEKCFDSCKTCNGSANNQCLTCFRSSTPPDSNSPYNNYFLYNNECLAQCPANTFTDINSTCQQCISGCEVCQSTTTCDKCQGNLIKYKTDQGAESCVSTCPDYYYTKNGTIKTCEKCISNCQKCNDNSTCNNCASGYYIENNTCNSCANKFGPNCVVCTPSNNPLDSSSCIQCKPGFEYSLTTKICEPKIQITMELNSVQNVYELKKQVDINLEVTSASACLIFNGQQTCQQSQTDNNMQVSYDQATFSNLNSVFIKVLPQPLKAQVKLTVKNYGEFSYEKIIAEDSVPQIHTYQEMLQILFNKDYKIYEDSMKSNPKVILPQIYNIQQKLNLKSKCDSSNFQAICRQSDNQATCEAPICQCSENFDGSDCTIQITMFKSYTKLLNDLLVFYNTSKDQSNYLRVQVPPTMIVSPVEYLQQSQSLLEVTRNVECTLATKSQAKSNAKSLLYRAFQKKAIADSVASAEEQGKLTFAIQNFVQLIQLNQEAIQENNTNIQIIIENLNSNSYLSCSQSIDQTNSLTKTSLFQLNNEDQQCQSSASRKVVSASIVNDKTLSIISSLDMLTSPKLQIQYTFSAEQAHSRFLASDTSSSQILNKATFLIDNLKQKSPQQIACVTLDKQTNEFVNSQDRVVDLMNQTISCMYHDNVSLVYDDQCKYLNKDSCSSGESSSSLSTSEIFIVVGSILGAIIFIFVIVYALRVKFHKKQLAKEQKQIEQSQITEINLQKRIKTELEGNEENSQL